MTSSTMGIAPTPPAAAPDETGPRGWYTVGILSVVAMLSYLDRGVLSLFVQPLKQDFGLSDTQVSMLLGLAFSVPAIVVGIPMSRLIDTGVRRSLIAACLAVWSFATAICGVAQNFWTLFACRALTGASESVNTSASLSVITDAVKRSRLPRAFAIQSVGVMVGSSLSLLLGGLLFGLFAHFKPIDLAGIGRIHNWQLVFLILGLPGLLVAALMMITVPEPRRKGGTRPGGYPIREVFGFLVAERGMHLRLATAMILFSIMTVGLGAWTPAFYQRTYGWGPEVAGPIMGIVSLVCSLIGLFAGARLAELFGKRNDDANLRVLLIAQGLALPLHVIAPLMPNPWAAISINAVAGIVGVMGGPAYYAAIQLTTPNEMRGQIAMLYAAGMNTIGGTAGPMLVGLLTDYVAPSEGDLRYVLVALNLLVVPPALYLLWKAMKPYARLYRARLDAAAG
ncbi:MFS transporter [Sphingobium nicotianae]|uniref:MFS transporter n=1 Tax=Sphingobium nicotianae TaxID=2782607 RepID=A0A9X1DAK8_9SPHN|nr:MFS transporter [Sphingobium nicotianae]MBT2186443.1 MFS transporter [Sphingobium nicotianae]